MASVPLKVLRGRKDRIIRELNKKQVKMCLSFPPGRGGEGAAWGLEGGVLGRLTEPEGWPGRPGWGGGERWLCGTPVFLPAVGTGGPPAGWLRPPPGLPGISFSFNRQP